jgi:hypothetical protein
MARMMRTRVAAAVAMLCLFSLTGCDDEEPAATPDRGADAPRLVLQPNEGEGAMTARFEGTLAAGDCIVLRRAGVDRVAIWPRRSRLVADGVELDGHTLRFGSQVVLGGGETADAEYLRAAGADDCGVDQGWIVGSVIG